MKYPIYLILVLSVCAQAMANSNLYVINDDDTLVSVLRAQGYGETYAELLPFIDEIVEINGDVFPDGNANFLIPGSIVALPDNPNLPEPESEPTPTPPPEPVAKPEPVIPTIGRIEVTSGHSEIQRDGETVLVDTNGDLYTRDIVLTLDKSVAEIILLDDTRVSMGPNSEFSVSEFVLVEPQSQGDSVLGTLVASIHNGVIRTITGLIGKLPQNQYQIGSTLNATIGIRGTDFTVRSCNDLLHCGDLYGVAVAVQDGSISFKNDAAEIELKQNEFAQVQSTSEAPTKAPLPEGFFDLQRDVSQIEVSRSWWDRSIDYLKALF